MFPSSLFDTPGAYKISPTELIFNASLHQHFIGGEGSVNTPTDEFTERTIDQSPGTLTLIAQLYSLFLPDGCRNKFNRSTLNSLSLIKKLFSKRPLHCGKLCCSIDVCEKLLTDTSLLYCPICESADPKQDITNCLINPRDVAEHLESTQHKDAVALVTLIMKPPVIQTVSCLVRESGTILVVTMCLYLALSSTVALLPTANIRHGR